MYRCFYLLIFKCHWPTKSTQHSSVFVWTFNSPSRQLNSDHPSFRHSVCPHWKLKKEGPRPSLRKSSCRGAASSDQHLNRTTSPVSYSSLSDSSSKTRNFSNVSLLQAAEIVAVMTRFKQWLNWSVPVEFFTESTRGWRTTVYVWTLKILTTQIWKQYCRAATQNIMYIFNILKLHM